MNPDPPSIFERLLVLYARKFPIRRGKLRVVDSIWRPLAGGRGSSRVATLKYGGFQMNCDLAEMLQRQFYFFGTYFLEEKVIDRWREEACDARLILDVGANAGIFSLAALAAQPSALVHAFEPTPEIAARLQDTAALNGLDQLNVHQEAVSSKDGHATLKRCRGELGTNEGMNFIAPQQGASADGSVRTVCLDSFCQRQGIESIDLLKLDIQGHEHSALSGAQNLLSDGRIGTVFTELNWAQNNDQPCAASESIRILEGSGYEFSEHGRHLKWKASGSWMRGFSDIVARRI